MYRSKFTNVLTVIRPKFYNAKCSDKHFSMKTAENLTNTTTTFKQAFVNNTLVDTYGRHHNYLRISLTEKCNLRSSLNSTRHSKPLQFNEHFKNIFFKHSLRNYSTNSDKLSHVDDEGKATMVDVTDKSITIRRATATAEVRVGHDLANIIQENTLKKGDVLSIAQLAGIVGAKKTSDLIPLCHNIPLTDVKVSVHLDQMKKSVIIVANVQCQGPTGVEMEALTAVSVAALTVYDMCKAVSRSIKITNIELLSKSGGSKGNYTKEEVLVRDYDTAPIIKDKVVLGNL